MGTMLAESEKHWRQMCKIIKIRTWAWQQKQVVHWGAQAVQELEMNSNPIAFCGTSEHQVQDSTPTI